MNVKYRLRRGWRTARATERGGWRGWPIVCSFVHRVSRLRNAGGSGSREGGGEDRREKRRARNKNVKRDSPRASSGVREDAARMRVYARVYRSRVRNRARARAFVRVCVCVLVQISSRTGAVTYTHASVRTRASRLFQRFSYFWTLSRVSRESPAARRFLLAAAQLLNRFIGRALPVTRGNATWIRVSRRWISPFAWREIPLFAAASRAPFFNYVFSARQIVIGCRKDASD